MHKTTYINSEYAVSEIVGGLILVLIAFVVIAAIYMYVFPLPLPPSETNVHLAGYVNSQGNVVLEHMGGETLSSYEVYVDGVLAYESTGTPWDIGEKYLPATAPLFDENDHVQITVYALSEDGSKPIVFDGIIHGKTQIETQPDPPTAPPMQISSLRTNTIDEDIICYNDTIVTTINPLTYIYNWMVNKGGNEQSITRVLMPFDTNSTSLVKDYSSNHYNGTVNGSVTWTRNGKVGGAYSFNGNGYITLPYCFSNPTIDKITVETWMKTSATSASFASFNRSKYWDFGINNGKIIWSTYANNEVVDLIGTSLINNNTWHYVAATYDSLTGDATVYVDGQQEKKENVHDPGALLGGGSNCTGFIGKGTTSGRETILSTSFETQDEKAKWMEDSETWGGGVVSQKVEVFYDNFEDDFGHWNDGGDNCFRNKNSDYAHKGKWTVCLTDNSGYKDSATYSDTIAAVTAGYTQMYIDFWWKAIDLENGEDFFIRYCDNGPNSVPQTLKTLVVGTGQYNNGEFYHTVCYLNSTQYSFTNNMVFVIQCDASDGDDYIYVDQIYVNATKESRVDYDFDLRNAAKLNPHSGNYSLGGSGDFDPDYAYFNRTGVSISGYSDVNVSVWYSYDSTESDDEFGLYYKDGMNWVPVFEALDPQIGDGNQLQWTHAVVRIPGRITTLVLQFLWSTSSATEYVAIDDLEITGVPPMSTNYSGILDEFRIYGRALSAEQIYQNYLCAKDGRSNKSVIVAEEYALGDIWKCLVTPNNGIRDDTVFESNSIQIIMYSGGGG